MVMPVHKKLSITPTEMHMPIKPHDLTLGHAPSSDLTKRELFALSALQGLCADASMRDVDKISKLAVEAADSLIDALNKVRP